MNAILDILQQKAPYLDSSRNKLILVVFLAIFSLIFMNVYSPFNLNDWTDNSLGYIVIGSLIILTSQFILRLIFGVGKFKLYQLVLWGACEVIAMAFVIYLIYGPEFPTFQQRLDEYLMTLKFVCLTIIGPYIFVVFYLAFSQKFFSYKEVAHNKLTTDPHRGNELLTLTGENNKVILAINYDQLLYVKSSGNYLDVYYLKGETASKELVRVSLKELEAKITDSSIVRIHRSYMVNKHKISSFKKTRKGYKLIVQHSPDEILPVSLGYKDKFEEALELNASH